MANDYLNCTKHYNNNNVIYHFYFSEFYGSMIADRYKTHEHELVAGRPVVVLYSNDLNYYRAIITAREDLNTFKVELDIECSLFCSNFYS